MRKLFVLLPIFAFCFSLIFAQDLDEILANGKLRHLGVNYANFNTGGGDGMSAELVRLFCDYLDVEYEYVECQWSNLIPNLIGYNIEQNGDNVTLLEEISKKGDIISTGLTILDWRKKVIDYSQPTFPTQVWLLARADSKINPIMPGNTPEEDIAQVKKLLNGVSLLGMSNTCLDPKLYNLEEAGAFVELFEGNLNQLAPALINNEAETCILDVPDALIALEKWSGEIKIIGPVSPFQGMGCGFAKTSPKLRDKFNEFLTKIKNNGVYVEIVKKYCPVVFDYYPDFFNQTN